MTGTALRGKPPQQQAQRLARHIFVMSVVNGIVTIAVIVGLAIWLAGQANMQERATSQTLFETALRAELDKVVISTRDYAYGDYAVELMSERQTDEIYEIFGTGATTSTTFDFIYLLDTNGSPLYAYQSGGTGSDMAIIDPQLSADLYAKIADVPMMHHVVASHFAYEGEHLAAVSATRMRPDNNSGRSASDFPIMIAGTRLTQDRLDHIARGLLLTDVDLNAAKPQIAFGRQAKIGPQASLNLRGIDGAPIAELAWTARRPGQALLNTTLPIVLALAALTFLTTLLVGRNASAQTAALLEQRQIARTDRLTGFINRAGLEDIIVSPAIKDAIAKGTVAIIYLDLNNFKKLNDTEGHDAGDMALKIFAERVNGALRNDDIIVRVGGDEFICVLVDDHPASTAEKIANRIKDATSPPLRIGENAHAITPSIGIAVGSPNLRWQDLQKNADRAMYHAKTSGTTDPVFYSDNVRQMARHKTRKLG
ncbi:diguanylate cyclase (GGDEF)-like protein [Yoonia maricola]|uniref:Diguanylate cyclase (GGDEF)-like protein n=1 Tax=Yoonia maricola TaxID=420999 RepID=A0A2M8WMY4_9RHOB|nr:diguanylate cyclase [Yoonia maricola]PJI92283.1 diguanylate cyclase (GGDEF)-like protein [Yoonia maricola]